MKQSLMLALALLVIAPSIKGDDNEKERKIMLAGLLIPGGEHKSAGNGVDAYYTASGLVTIDFGITASNVSISIVNSNGSIVYQTTTNVATGDRHNIAIIPNQSGTYVLTITTASGGNVYGGFTF